MVMTAPDASETLLHTIGTLEPVIRHHADDAERYHRLALPIVQALTDAGLFRMCVPRALGGLEVPPLTFYRVVEAVARLDGSTGWCTFIGGSDGLVGAYLPRKLRKQYLGVIPR
jgi:alkylation response protein AidB-like acyl-CoA dehydrogenase